MTARTLAYVALTIVGLVVVAQLVRTCDFTRDYGQLTRPSSYSISAVGLALFYETLTLTDLKPQRAFAGQNAWKPGPNQLVVLADPVLSLTRRPDLAEAPRLLVILPKYIYQDSLDKPAWLEQAQARKANHLGPLWRDLGLIDADAPPSEPDLTLTATPKEWPQTLAGHHPTFPAQTQLLREPALSPLIAAPEGLVLGERWRDQRQLLILADPDLVNNHGLGQGDNLALTMAALKVALPNGGEVIFDEPILSPPKPRARANPDLIGPVELPAGPEIIIFAQIFLAALLAAFSGGSRFGPPLKEDKVVDFGRKKLIDNSARLLERASRQKAVTQDYLAMIAKAAAKAARLPRGLSEAETLSRLDLIDRRFSLKKILGELARASSPTPKTCLEWAKKAYAWKARLESGSESGRRNN
ncbi:MAG: hypothetical protein LBR11_10905 [Deltaproteobacteria bacterium]|nr:hypothetical protein [Deltaproteobacteria bacterium]